MNDFYQRYRSSSKYLRWKGFSDKGRHGAIKEIEEVVNKFGCISDFYIFSDTELCIRIDVQECRLEALYKALSGCLALDESEIRISNSEKERSVLLDVTVLEGTGNKETK